MRVLRGTGANAEATRAPGMTLGSSLAIQTMIESEIEFYATGRVREPDQRPRQRDPSGRRLLTEAGLGDGEVALADHCEPPRVPNQEGAGQADVFQTGRGRTAGSEYRQKTSKPFGIDAS